MEGGESGKDQRTGAYAVRGESEKGQGSEDAAAEHHRRGCGEDGSALSCNNYSYFSRAINSLLERAQKRCADDKVWQKEQREYKRLMLKAKAAYREDLETSSQETGDGH